MTPDTNPGEERRAEALRRSTLTRSAIDRASDAAAELTGAIAPGRSKGTVGCYCGVRGELDASVLALRGIIDSCALPHTVGSTLVFRRWFGEPLAVGRFHVPEAPPDNPSVPLSALSAIVVPTVLWGERGERVGHGAGYYDRFLRRCRAHRLPIIGWGWEEARRLHLATAAWETKLSAMVTPQRTIIVDESMFA